MKKKEVKPQIPDITEFTDENGKKWVQTSTEDLFTMNELNEILSKIEEERDDDGVVLARIDFQKVDREFYDAAVDLQKKLVKQTELMKQYVGESGRLIERKNKKIKELVDYIKKLHLFLAYLNENPDETGSIDFSNLSIAISDGKPEYVSVYDDVEETEVPLEENSD